MSFGFGKNSGPTAPPSEQISFGNFPQPTSPVPSVSPFSDPNLSAGPRFLSHRTFDGHARVRLPTSFVNDPLVTSPVQYAAPNRWYGYDLSASFKKK